MANETAKPVLWNLPVSHFSEKARWALDWKGIDYESKRPPGGAHMAVALWLTRGRGYTMPVLQLDGRTIGDSSAIIAALEERYPDPPLMPADPGERRRALALAALFDERLGPDLRLLVWHETRRDPEALAELTRAMTPPRLHGSGLAQGAGTRLASAFAQARFRVADEDAAARARESVLAALARLEEELERSRGEHLVGDRFSVADLTAAALLYPLVQPPEGPAVLSHIPEGLERFRAGLGERPGYRWVERTFASYRHRGDRE